MYNVQFHTDFLPQRSALIPNFDCYDYLGQFKKTIIHMYQTSVVLHVDSRFFFKGEYKKDELLEAARSGNEDKLMSLLTPLNVNCHASDGRKVREV